MMRQTIFAAGLLLFGMGCSRENSTMELATLSPDAKIDEALKMVNSRLYRCIQKPEDVEGFQMRHVDPPDVMERQGFNSTRTIVAPDPTQLKPPRWEGEVLVIDCVMYLPSNTFQDHHSAKRYRFSFEGKRPEHKDEELRVIPITPTRAPAAINEAFGGTVNGFLKVLVAPNSEVSIAVGAQPGAHKVLWKTPQGTQEFASFESFAQSDALKTPEALNQFAQGLNQIMSAGGMGYNSGLRAIENVSTYKTQYREKQSHVHKLRYQHDKIKETHFRVNDWDAIQDPRIENGRLIAFFHDPQNQPHRIEVDLEGLTWGQQIQAEPLFTEESVSDTGRPLPP